MSSSYKHVEQFAVESLQAIEDISLGDVPLARRLIDLVADKALAWRMVKKDAQANKLFSAYRQKSIVHLVFLFLQGHLIQSVPIN